MKSLKRILCGTLLFVSLLTLLSSLATVCFALADPEYRGEPDIVDEYVKWERLENGKLTDGTRVYTRKELPTKVKCSFLSMVYNYYQPPERFSRLRGNAREADAVIGSANPPYFTEEAAKEIDALINGEYAFRVLAGYGYSEEMEELFKRIEAADFETETFVIEDIMYKLEGRVFGYDKFGTCFIITAAFYDNDGVYYYLDLTGLDDSYFDYDWNFPNHSVKSRTVEVLRIDDEEMTATLNAAFHSPQVYPELVAETYRSDPELVAETYRRNSARSVILTMTMIFGVIAPGIFTVMFIIRALGKRSPGSYRFLIPAAFGILIILLSVINMINIGM